MKNIDEIIAKLAADDSESLENQSIILAVGVRSKTGEVVISEYQIVVQLERITILMRHRLRMWPRLM